MTDITEHADKHTAKRKRGRLVFDSLAENAGQADNGKRYDVIEQNNGENALPACNIRKSIESEQLLNNAVNKTCTESPAETVTVSDDSNRQHRSDGNRASRRKTDNFDHAQNSGERNHDGAFHKSPYGFVFHLKNLLKIKLPHENNTAIISRSVASIIFLRRYYPYQVRRVFG